MSALLATGLLETDAEPAFDRLTQLAARVSGAPVALLTLIADDRQVVKSTFGVPQALAGPREVPRSHCLCLAVVDSGAPLAIADARVHPGFADNRAVVEWGVVAYCGVPLAADDGHVLGTLSVMDHEPRVWDEETVAALHELARLGGTELGVRRQLAERMRIEAQLRASEERFHVLCESSPIGIFHSDATGSITYANSYLQRLFGEDEAELLGRGWLKGVHPDDREALWAPWMEALAAGGDYDHEYRIVRPDGTTRQVRGRAVALRDATGAVVGTVGTVEDATERRRAEDALRTSEARYRTLVEAAHVGVCTVDLVGRITYVNPRFVEMLGYPATEVVGRQYFDLMEGDQAVEARTRFARLQRGFSETVELPMRCRNGEMLWVSRSAGTLHDADGAFAGAVLMISDVTARRDAVERLHRNEQHFRALVENASDMVAILDANGVTRYVSPPAERFIGYTAGELVDTRAAERIHPDDRPDVEAALARLVAGRARSAQMEFRYRHKDGRWRTLSSVATNLLGDPAVDGIVVNSRDITDESLMAAQLRQAQKLEAIGRLAGGVAHDFNNLIQVITVSTMFARDAVSPDSPAFADLAEVDAAAERAAQLTRQLLAFSRQQVLRPRAVDLNDLAGGVERMLRRVIGEDVACVLDLDPVLAPVEADPGQIEQVLINLAVNARDAMPMGGTLTIETRNVTVEEREAARRPGLVPGAYVALRVRDTGVGMDEATQSRAFEPFFTTKEPGKGTGLGLATVYGIVKQSGGYVYVDSAPGAGSTLLVLLPPHPEAMVRDPAPPETPAPRGRETVLVVEDEPAVRLAVRRMLERGGYTVLEATDGIAALDALERAGGRVDLVLTDAIMPTLGARGLLERLRADRPGIKALVMSGYSEDAVALHGVLAEGVDLLSKPVRPDVLLQRVRDVLDGRGAESGRGRAADPASGGRSVVV